MPNLTTGTAWRFRLGSALGTHRCGDSSSHQLSDVFVGRFHHDPDHWLSARGAQQDPTGVTQLGLGLIDRGLYLRSRSRSRLVSNLDVDEHLRQRLHRRGEDGQ